MPIEEKCCRICLSEEEPGNPIISPCNCTGSVKYIHLDCIREWLEGKKTQKMYSFRKFIYLERLRMRNL